MGLFKKAEMTSAFLKMGIYGDPGTGKTFTASHIARGLALRIAKSGKAKPSVMFLDTEGGSTFVTTIFEAAGIDFQIANTRSFQDLKTAVREAESAGAILIVDSMTHFWEEIREAYVIAKRQRLKNPHARIELPDWNVIKPMWGTFTTLFLNSNCHIILCGRAGSVYETQEDEETHKKQMIAAGTRMAAEKGMGYEPSILVEMTTRQAKSGKTKTIIRTATVLKDRWDVLDGLQFEDPTFENFLPHIERLNLGGTHGAVVDTSRTSEGTFPADGEARDIRVAQRRVALGDIQDTLVLHIPGQSATEKQRKILLCKKHFGGGWAEMEELMSLERLKLGLASLKAELEPEEQVVVPPVDEIPHLEPMDAQLADGTVTAGTKPRVKAKAKMQPVKEAAE